MREDNARFYYLGPNGPDDKKCIYLAPVKDYITSIRSQLNYETQKSYLWNSYIEFSESFYQSLAVLVDPSYISASLEWILLTWQIY